MKDARAQFDVAKQNEKLARAHEVLVNDAAGLIVVHDLNPRAMSAKVNGFVPARNWYQDYTPVTVGELTIAPDIASSWSPAAPR